MRSAFCVRRYFFLLSRVVGNVLSPPLQRSLTYFFDSFLHQSPARCCSFCSLFRRKPSLCPEDATLPLPSLPLTFSPSRTLRYTPQKNFVPPHSPIVPPPHPTQNFFTPLPQTSLPFFFPACGFSPSFRGATKTVGIGTEVAAPAVPA